MNAIAYCQPLVPPEWIAAHGLQPHWLRLRIERRGIDRRRPSGACVRWPAR